MELLLSILSTGIVAVLAFILGVVILVLWQHRSIQKKVGHIPTARPTHWLYGSLKNFPGLNEEGLAYILETLPLQPRIRLTWVGPFKAYVELTHPETAKEILRTTEPKATDALGLYHMGLPWLGEGLLISHGPKWSRNRRLLTPAFHFEILQPYIDVYNKAADILLGKFKDATKDGSSVEIYNAVSLCTLDIILKCVFSHTEDVQLQGDNHPYVHAVSELNDLWIERTIKPHMMLDFIFYLTKEGRAFKKYCHYVHSVAEDIIEKRRQTLEKEGVTKSRYLDFLDILITAKDEDGNGLTPLEIRNEVDTFLFEGHDTTASAISWVLYSLAAHSMYQERVHEELDQYLENGDNITESDLPKLEYLTCCIKEAMRINAPVSYIQRLPTKDMIIDGYKVPAGIPISVMIYAMHNNPVVWDEPSEYRPERFSPENCLKRDSFAFIPFSAGPRNCIGQHLAMDEMKVVISRILSRFTISLDPNHVVRRKPRLVMKTENGIKLFMVPRTPRP